MTGLALVVAALVCWTCTNRPAVRAEVAAPAEAASGGESGAEPVADGTLAEEAGLETPANEDLDEPAIDEGIPGLRIAIRDPGHHALDHFHDSLRRTQAHEATTRIAFFGASHVAADFFTGYVREQLQTRFGDGGHGFILPAQPWRSYRHLGIQLESSWRLWDGARVRQGMTDIGSYGYAGVAVESNRRGAWGAIETAASGSVGRTAGIFELYYLSQPGGGDLDLLIDGRRAERITTAADAPTASYARFEREDGRHRLEVRLRGNGPVRLFGLVVERAEPGVVVDTLGINGARARNQLLWEDATFREHLRRRAPDLVVLAYGTNEAGDDDVPIAAYEERLRQVVGRIRETLPESSCVLIGPSDRPLRDAAAGVVEDRPRTTQINDVQRRVAAELGCGFFDVLRFMGGPLSMVEWVEAGYGAPDHVHFTRTGYLRMGDVLFGALVRGYGDLPEPVSDPTATANGTAETAAEELAAPVGSDGE